MEYSTFGKLVTMVSTVYTSGHVSVMYSVKHSLTHTDHTANPALHKRCSFVVTITTSCYVSPNDTSLLVPPLRTHTLQMCLRPLVATETEQHVISFRKCVFPKVSIKAIASSNIKEADCGFPSFQGSAAAKNLVRLDQNSAHLSSPLPWPLFV